MTARRTPSVFVLSRPLPPGAVVQVRPGLTVAANTVLALGHAERRVLRLPPGGNFELLKKAGDPVRTAETIAAAEELFGFGLREYLSPVDGVVESYNPVRGALVLTGVQSEVRALVPGVVEDVTPGEVRLRVTGYRLPARFGLGPAVAANLLPVGDLSTDHAVRRLGPEAGDRIVLADAFVLPTALTRLAELGAAGLVCGGLDFGPLWDLVGPGRPFASGIGLPTIALFGGFGDIPVPEESRRILAAAAGQPVYVAGPAERRLVLAGPPFPEVIVPAHAPDDPGPSGDRRGRARVPALAPPAA